MAKVIHLFKEHSDLVNKLDEVLKLAISGELKTVMIAGKDREGNVVTGWVNLDLVERQELISHMQIDLTMGLLEEVFKED